jgi:putative ABC transport system ATP-binding protein
MVTHDPTAASVADRIVVLKDGKVVSEGPAGDRSEVVDLMREVA